MNTSFSEIAITIFVTIAGSSAIFTFIQFLIDRRDRKEQRYSKLEEDIDLMKSEIAKLGGKIEEANIIQARTRILRASDEIRREMKYSQEFFDQLNEDITEYNKYCEDHRNFKNNKAINAIDNINRAYQEAIRNNDFL